VPTETLEAFKNVPLLEGLDERHLQRLANAAKERRYREGDELTSEGAERGSRFFFVIGEGNATVTRGGGQLATLGPGDYFGEMALIDEGARSATVVAATDMLTYTLTPWEFRPFVEENPEVAWTLLRTLTERLRAAETR
jgi:CRP/FNR family transcriptional regulator, cyclic AMP receptor protein